MALMPTGTADSADYTLVGTFTIASRRKTMSNV